MNNFTGFTERENAEIAANIRFKREIPLKYTYFGRGGELWKTIDIENTAEQVILRAEMDYLLELLPGNKPVTVVDMGSGSGEAIGPIIDALTSITKLENYHALDLSEDFLISTQEVFSARYPQVSINTETADLDSTDLPDQVRRLSRASTTVFALLGSTLCNQQDPRNLVQSIRSAMNQGDVLILGTELLSEREKKELDISKNSPKTFEMQFSLLEHLGVNHSDGEFITRFNTEKNQAETIFKVAKPLVLTIGAEKVPLRAGEELLLLRVADFSKEYLPQFLTSQGLRIQKRVIRNGFSVCFCQTS